MQNTRPCTLCRAEYEAGHYAEHAAGHGPDAHRPTKRERRSQRDLDIVAAMNADPYLTLQQLADKYGLTRERIRQVYLRDTGTSTAIRRPPGRRPRTCPKCGGTYLPGQSRAHFDLAGHNNNQTKEQRQRDTDMVQLYEDGLSSVQIGRIYDMRATTVVTKLRRLGVQLTKGRRGGVVVRKRHVDAER